MNENHETDHMASEGGPAQSEQPTGDPNPPGQTEAPIGDAAPSESEAKTIGG